MHKLYGATEPFDNGRIDADTSVEGKAIHLERSGSSDGGKRHLRLRSVLPALLAVGVAAGCSGNGATEGEGTGGKTSPPAVEKPAKPVTLSIYFKCFQVTDEEFNRFYAEPVRSKYPHITLQNMSCGGPNEYKDMIVTNSLPDIIVDGVTNLRDLVDAQIPLDLTPLAERQGFPLTSVSKQALDFVRGFSPSGELYSLPITLNAFATYYNKDVFDMLGVPYPKDGATWEDYIAMARKLSVQRDGISYMGLQMGAFNRLPSQLSLAYASADGKAAVQQAGWRTVFETWKTIHDIEGNRPADPKQLFSGRNRFVKDRNVAVFPDIAMPEGSLLEYEKTGGKWDIVSFPSFKDKPKTGVGVFANGMSIPRTSKNQDEAFRVIAHLLSEEAQSAAARNGWMPAIDKLEAKQQLLANSELYKGKNIPAFYYNDLAAPFPMTKYDALATARYTEALRSYVYESKDVNTALREAEEAANKAIAEEKAK